MSEWLDPETKALLQNAPPEKDELLDGGRLPLHLTVMKKKARIMCY